MAVLWSALNCGNNSLLPCPLTASKVSYLRPLSILLSIFERNVHRSAPVEGKYHYLARKRKHRYHIASQQRAKLRRLDPEDRPTGCLLCPMRNDVEIDYKNVRLLSQFVSPHTGRIYGRQLTGLCNNKQKELASAIRRARAMGFMPVTMKYLDFHADPKLF